MSVLQGKLGSARAQPKNGALAGDSASLAAAAKQLVAALHSLEAAGKQERPWSTAAFQGKALYFIDEEGHTQA